MRAASCTVKVITTTGALALAIFALGALADEPTSARGTGQLVVAVRSDGAVTQLGPLRLHPSRSGGYGSEATYRAVVNVLGQPGAVRRGARYECAARWFRHGLRIVFADYSGLTACTTGGWVQEASMTGARWRTAEGLRIGERVEDLQAVYPDAERHGSVWWLIRAFTPIGESGWYGALIAVVRDGRVTGFQAPVGAGGE
ncbi:MAG: hypothetical protein JWQ48_527 [Conexibacter sp.]|nr:hypothetical protein [Conexibacter sp.]